MPISRGWREAQKMHEVAGGGPRRHKKNAKDQASLSMRPTSAERPALARGSAGVSP